MSENSRVRAVCSSSGGRGQSDTVKGYSGLRPAAGINNLQIANRTIHYGRRNTKSALAS